MQRTDRITDLNIDIHVVCCRRVWLDGAQPPYRNNILPLCISSGALLHAVIAASVNDFRNQRNFRNSSSCNHAILYHKSKALEILQHVASNARSFDNDSLITIIMMLCYLEIAMGCRYNWTAHLSGATSLLKLKQVLRPETLRFVYQRFTIRDISSATTSDEGSYYSSHSNS
jgi:hypothetical protein